ncbi:hypothetical protein C2845_PM12G03850 [Panicum miliaceum]|uniref:DUF6598 domain-containing protein n=1 Tax=Panicum miliaceum TaxID=4540 RepID=A0A3L6QKK5_PANMI|nr:hypothetical protein C2845_PM12G03850 [Panicum miliaceum]
MAEAEAAMMPKVPTWAEAQAMRKRLSLISQKADDFYMMTKDEKLFLDLTEAEREAKLALVMDERDFLLRLYVRLSSQMRTPDFSGMTEADRAVEAEKLRQEALEEARCLKMEGDPDEGLRHEGWACIIDFDPKQRGLYYTRCFFVDLATFDHDKESPLDPMRYTYTATVYENNTCETCEAVNILSVKIASLDVGFPIQVYGTVIARDCLDHKCVYIFRRSRDHCQLINSKNEPLILTGPKRGLVLLDDNYVEIDLKIKDHQGQDRELSKGIITIRGTAHRLLEKCEVERKSLATRLSTVDVLYAAVIDAVEATIAIKVLRGNFDGTITARTSSIQRRIVLYDSKIAGTRTRDGGFLRLMRYVASVNVNDMLIIEAKTGDGKSVRRIDFTPKGNSFDEDTITVGATKVCETLVDSRLAIAWVNYRVDLVIFCELSISCATPFS